MENVKINDEFIEYFNKDLKHIEDVSNVLKFILSHEINIKTTESNVNTGSFAGLATLYGIYFDIKVLDSCPNMAKSFIMLHEFAHYKRMKKLGKNKILSDLSDSNFDSFCEKVINEEIIADRYASFSYFKITGKKYPKVMTQQLELPEYQYRYKILLKRVFGLNDGTEETYKENLKKLFKIDV